MSATSKKTHLEIITPIKESSIELSSLVKIDEAILKSVIDGDPNPEFVIVEFEECKSGNNVTYDREFFVSLAEQINTKMPPGYLGHKHFQGLDKEDLLPDPQVVWLGATVDTSGGKARCITKGYLLPATEGGKARAWIKRRAINSVSWSADAMLTLGKDGSYRVKEFFLESIDFARKNREGVKNQRLTVVTEMEGSEKGVDEDDVKGIVGKLTFHELKEYNPGLVNVIKEQTKDEVKDETATAVAEKEKELTTKHTQEIKENPDVTMMQKIKTLLGIVDDENAKPDEIIVTMLERLDEVGKKLVQNWFRTEILDKKVPNEKARKLVGRLIPVTEMNGDWRSDKGIEKIKTELETKADDLLDNDEDIQTVLKEMGSSRGGPRFSDRKNNDDKDRQSNDDDDDNYENFDLKEMNKRGNLKLEKVKVGL